jgi:NitT/TauT family transport system substrate-binding protein
MPWSSATAAPVKRASLRFNWTYKGEFAPFFVAREKGFYREQGVELALEEGKSGTQAVQVVGAGSDQFAYVPSVQVIKGINEGVPLTTIAALGRWTGMVWAAWPDVPLQSPKDLEGRRVSISAASTFFQVWPAFARRFNIDMAKVEVVQPDPAARFGLFTTRKVDILADLFLANDYIIIQSLVPERLNVLKLSDYNFDPLGYLLVVNRSVLQRDPNLVRRIVTATLKGFQATIDNPNEAAEIMARLFGDRIKPEILRGQVQQLVPMIVRQPALGQAPDTDWARSLTILFTSGVIDKRLPLAEYRTNEFVKR